MRPAVCNGCQSRDRGCRHPGLGCPGDTLGVSWGCRTQVPGGGAPPPTPSGPGPRPVAGPSTPADPPLRRDSPTLAAPPPRARTSGSLPARRRSAARPVIPLPNNPPSPPRPGPSFCDLILCKNEVGGRVRALRRRGRRGSLGEGPRSGQAPARAWGRAAGRDRHVDAGAPPPLHRGQAASDRGAVGVSPGSPLSSRRLPWPTARRTGGEVTREGSPPGVSVASHQRPPSQGRVIFPFDEDRLVRVEGTGMDSEPPLTCSDLTFSL